MPDLPQPLFDSPRAALRFAMNHTIATPRPVMNRMMADEAQLKKVELEDGTSVIMSMKRSRPNSEQLRGLDGAATAGLILQHLQYLDDPEQLVLTAASSNPMLPCPCRSPCCSGFRLNTDWSRAVIRLCDHLRDEAELSKIPGKKGMSTDPMMRRAIVEKHFLPDRKLDIPDLAKACNCSVSTVYNHTKLIGAALTQLEYTGWTKFDRRLTDAGIVGTIY